MLTSLKSSSLNTREGGFKRYSWFVTHSKKLFSQVQRIFWIADVLLLSNQYGNNVFGWLNKQIKYV